MTRPGKFFANKYGVEKRDKRYFSPARLMQPAIGFLLVLLAACQQEGPAPTPTAPATAVSTITHTVIATRVAATQPTATAAPTNTPTPTPAPPTPTPVPLKELVVCMAAEPADLYWYGDSSLAATAVRHALYENLYTTLAYDYQPQALRKLPSLRDGDAAIRAVDVQENDLVVSAAGNLVRLLPGTQIVDADGNAIIYRTPAEDAPLQQMQQMVVEFTFDSLVWSDGTPVTAEDSVYSFHIAADPATPGDKSKIERTAHYEAVDEQRVRWVGLPGFWDPGYATNVWMPLPRHQLEGLTAEELLAAPETTQFPLSSGPFVVEEWQPGEAIRLVRNPSYFRAETDLPPVEVLTIRFDVDLADPITAVTSGACDVVTQDGLGLRDLSAVQAAEDVIPFFTPNTIFEHMDFGINSWGYGDDLFAGRRDWFEFVPVRQAIAHCLNRQRLVDELLAGQGQVMDAYIPADHPLFPADATLWPYDLAAGNALLDGFGLEDTDGDGWREWVERDLQRTIVATTTFSITLGTDSSSPVRLRLNELAQEDLAACGIQVNVYDVPAETWYDDGPFSPLFGRRFDLATFAWRTAIRPPCTLYLSTNITGPEEQGFGGWNNVNVTGWGSTEYDAACQVALNSLPGTDAYESNHQEAVRIFTDRLPSIPLFQYVKTAVTAPTVLNFKPDPTQLSELWNVFEWDKDEQ